MDKPGDKLDGERPSEDRRQILLHLDGGLIKDLKKAAVDLDSSASAIASEAINDWLRKKGLRKEVGE